jgi:glycosyltransferase involved in cell wall biosynthesis
MNNQTPVSVVLVVFNEAEIISEVVDGFHRDVTSKIPGAELLVAEDGSSDGTKEILLEKRKSIPELRLEMKPTRQGYTSAFNNAIRAARNELVLFCDASGKHDPKDYWSMVPNMETHDLVIGYKEDRQDPFYRIVLTRVFNALVSMYFGVRFRDCNSPMRLFRRPMFEKISQEPWLQAALVNFEFSLRAAADGYKIKEVPIRHFARKHGASRGLPVKKIPKAVLQTLGNFPKIKARFAKTPAKQMST